MRWENSTPCCMISLMKHFYRIGLFAKQSDASVLPTLQKLIHFLKKQGAQLILEKHTANLGADPTLPAVEKEALGKHCDLAIVVGGDGSLLNLSRALVADQIPVLGVNQGKLGFLVDILPDVLETELGHILNGQYLEERRFLLEATIQRQGREIAKTRALNDAVLHSNHYARMIDFEIYINEQFVLRQQADGAIVSTPTGSTAYALSAGGPILHPALNAISITPLCPHTLSSRPMVIDNSNRIALIVSQKTASATLSIDGQIQFELQALDEITLKKYPIDLTLIHPKNYHYFSVLREKLGWNK